LVGETQFSSGVKLSFQNCVGFQSVLGSKNEFWLGLSVGSVE
jgi:hypothetical protein